ncbi:MAG: hypothetical protein K2J80_10125 [Oscillospiraceae bacterium]|nr:hypothetical protein [Oscillospiraceae bacterium]
MIISKQEFKELGFECDAQSESRLEGCIKRAEIVLNALSRGTLKSAMTKSSGSAALIKQAAAFEADALMKSEREISSGSERVSIGDLSYSESSDTSVLSSAVDVPNTVKRLLNAAGCYYGSGITEVIE